MKALVTGATGPVGQAVVARLLADGHDATVVSRRPFLAERLYADGVALHEWHPLSELLSPAAIGDCDSILSLMGSPLAGRPSRDRERLAVASRAKAIQRIRAATAGRGQRVVVASLANAPTEPGEPFREDAAASTPQSPLARLVADWETEAQSLRGGERSVAIVRLGLVATDSCVVRELGRLARMGIIPNLKGALIPAIGLEDAARMLVGVLQQPSIVGLVHGVAPVPVKGEAVMAALRTLSPVARPLVLPLSLLRRRLGLAVALLGCKRQIAAGTLGQTGADFGMPDPTEQLVQVISRLGGGGAAPSPSPEPSLVLRRQP